MYTQETLSKRLTKAFATNCGINHLAKTCKKVIKGKPKGQIREKGNINRDKFQEI